MLSRGQYFGTRDLVLRFTHLPEQRGESHWSDRTSILGLFNPNVVARGRDFPDVERAAASERAGGGLP